MTEAAQVKIDTKISSDIRAEPPTLCWSSERINRALDDQKSSYPLFVKHLEIALK